MWRAEGSYGSWSGQFSSASGRFRGRRISLRPLFDSPVSRTRHRGASPWNSRHPIGCRCPGCSRRQAHRSSTAPTPKLCGRASAIRNDSPCCARPSWSTRSLWRSPASRSPRGWGAACALARAGHIDDPRVRGTAHTIASNISQFLRSELAGKPFRKAHGKTVLEPAAYPPTVFAVEMLACLPPVQRERAGFIERLGQYFSAPAPRRAFFILAGKKLFKPMFELLGDPLRSDAQGHISDIPFAVYWLELLARLGLARQIPSAHRVLARLYSECDDQGIWSPKSLRAMPKATNPVTAHYFPLEGPGKSPAQRQTDVTFRLGLIARLMGIPVEVV